MTTVMTILVSNESSRGDDGDGDEDDGRAAVAGGNCNNGHDGDDK